MIFRNFSALLLIAALFGCASKELPELTLQQVPEALRKAFATSKKTFLKKNAESIAILISDKQYPAASLQLQALTGNPDLTDEQAKVVAAATVTINRTLQELADSVPPTAEPAPAQAQAATPIPNKEESAAAAAVLQHYIQTK